MGLSMKIGPVTPKNPVIVTSGEHGRDGRTLADVAATGVGAVTTKTIIPFPVPDPLPCYSLVPNGFLNCVLAAGADHGMDAVEVTDPFEPVMSIDIATGQPKLGGPRGFGALSGGALKPIALRMVYEIAETFPIPVIASGGIMGWEDAVECLVAGASRRARRGRSHCPATGSAPVERRGRGGTAGNAEGRREVSESTRAEESIFFRGRRGAWQTMTTER